MSTIREAQASRRLDGETRCLPLTLPALSLSQPWCELVLGEAAKDIENRTWNCHKRGWFLIHASAGMTGRQYRDAVSFAANATGRVIDTGAGIRYVPLLGVRHDEELILPDPREIVRGGLLGAAEILDVVPLDRMSGLRVYPSKQAAFRRHHHADNPWLMDGCYGFVLGRRVRLPFRAMNGRQRWFHVELTADEEALLRAAGLVTP